jgi:hypothetical protein
MWVNEKIWPDEEKGELIENLKQVQDEEAWVFLNLTY